MAIDGQGDGSKPDWLADSQPGTLADDQIEETSNAGPSPREALPPQQSIPAGGGNPPPPGYGYYAPAWPGVPVQLGPAPGLAYAGMAVRFGALLIDAVILTIVVGVAGAIGEAFGIQHYANGDVYSAGAIAADLLGFLALAAYMPSFWWTFQGTPGQRALGLRVVRAANGQSLGIGATTIRYVIWLVCMFTVLLAVVAAIMASDKPSKQAWPDDVAGSVVVKRV